jgi:hypothetical protein
MDRYELAAAAMGSPTYVPNGSEPAATREQEKRIEACALITRKKRRFAKYRVINDARNAAEDGEVNCRQCAHASGIHAEHQVAWCSQLRFRVSTWHPVLCNGFKAAA